MADKIGIPIRYPATARDASVILLGQILTAINLGHLVAAEGKEVALEKWKARADVTISDAKVEIY